MADGTVGVEPQGLLRAPPSGKVGDRVVLILAGLLAALALGAMALLAAGGPSRQPIRLAAAPGPAAPSAASLAASRGVGSDQRSFWVARQHGGLLAANAAQRMRAAFTAEGVRVSVPGGSVGLSLTGVGRGGSLAEASPVRPEARTNRAVYRRGGVTEWYANGPLGLEQGLTLRAPPGSGSGSGSGSGGDLSLAFALGGAAARLEDGQVTFTGARGTAILRYSGLSATDASGRLLPARLQIDGHQLLIRVDDRGARYPVTVDPLMQAATLTASDAVATQQYQLGFSVAQSGSILIAGDPNADPVSGSSFEDAGAAYVFTEPPSGWASATQTAKLTASVTPSLSLGSGVAVSGNTAFVVGTDRSSGSSSVVYVYTLSGTAWKQTALLTPSTATSFIGLGPAGIVASGSNLFIGAPEGGKSSQGAVYVFTEPKTGWKSEHESALLTPSDANFDFLGASVAVSADGQTLVAGAPFAGASGQPGAAYVFEAKAGKWPSESQSAVLRGPAGADSNAAQLGDSVAIDGSTIFAGAPIEQVGATASAGAVFVYNKPATGWANKGPSATLTADDGVSRDLFGLRIAAGDYPVNAADGPDVGDAGSLSMVQTVFVGTGGGAGIYRFAEPTAGWSGTTAGPAVLGLKGASTFSLSLAGGYLLEGNDPNGETAPTLPGTVNVFESASASTTSVSCDPDTVAAASATSCTATVTDISATAPSSPSGSVTFSSSDSGGAFVGSPCTLVATGAGTSDCNVSYTPAAAGAQAISAIYGGDTTHSGSNGSADLTVTSAGGGGGGGGGGGAGAGGGGGVPVNTGPPSVSGTPLPGDHLTCSTGSWTNSPTGFSYTWQRGASVIAGATSSTYTVAILDEAQSLTCTVIASNGAGLSAPATSLGVLVAVKGTLNCPKPSGRLSGARVGPLSLGMTQKHARHILTRFAVTHNRFDDFCLYAGFGIRVGYPSKKLLGSLPASHRRGLKNKIVLALTANPFYALRGVTPGVAVTAAKHRLKLGKVFHVGRNDWYIASGHSANVVVKVRHGVIQEIGVANRQLTRGRTKQKRFLTSFTDG